MNRLIARLCTLRPSPDKTSVLERLLFSFDIFHTQKASVLDAKRNFTQTVSNATFFFSFERNCCFKCFGGVILYASLTDQRRSFQTTQMTNLPRVCSWGKPPRRERRTWWWSSPAPAELSPVPPRSHQACPPMQCFARCLRKELKHLN